MNIRDSINRGFNLLAVSVVALSGFAFLPEIFLENDIPDKIDDLVLFVLGIAGMMWYRRNNNRFQRSVAPVILVGLALFTKIAAIAIEFNDSASVGDDFGALILFVLSLGLVWYQYSKNKQLLNDAQ